MGAPHEDLKLLSIFHYVLAGLTAFFALFPLVYVGFGVAMITGRLDGGHGQPPPPFVGWVVIAIGLAFMLAGWTYAVLVALAGRWIARRRGWLFVMVMAGLSCTWMPFGTVLGVFTLVTLSRPEVKALFGPAAGASPATGWAPPPPGEPPRV